MNFLLNQSFSESKAIEIIYQNKDNVFSKRHIIVKAINESYIKAYCLSKKQTRIFKIDAILAVLPVEIEKRGRFYA